LGGEGDRRECPEGEGAASCPQIEKCRYIHIEWRGPLPRIGAKKGMQISPGINRKKENLLGEGKRWARTVSHCHSRGLGSKDGTLMLDSGIAEE